MFSSLSLFIPLAPPLSALPIGQGVSWSPISLWYCISFSKCSGISQSSSTTRAQKGEQCVWNIRGEGKNGSDQSGEVGRVQIIHPHVLSSLLFVTFCQKSQSRVCVPTSPAIFSCAAHSSVDIVFPEARCTSGGREAGLQSHRNSLWQPVFYSYPCDRWLLRNHVWWCYLQQAADAKV